MDVNNKIPGTTICIVSCFFVCLSLASSRSYANPHDDDITSAALPAENAITTTDSSTHEDEGDYDMGYLEGCAGGAVAGSVFPGIGTLIGTIAGCTVAFIW